MIKLLTILLIINLSAIFYGCASILTFPNRFVMFDRFNKKHIYKSVVKTLDGPVVLYCQEHHKFETIKPYYTKKGVEYWVRNNKS